AHGAPSLSRHDGGRIDDFGTVRRAAPHRRCRARLASRLVRPDRALLAQGARGATSVHARSLVGTRATKTTSTGEYYSGGLTLAAARTGSNLASSSVAGARFRTPQWIDVAPQSFDSHRTTASRRGE